MAFEIGKETSPCPGDTALDRAHGASADRGSLFIGTAAGANEHDRLPLFRRQPRQASLQVLQIQFAVLIRLNRYVSCNEAVGIFDLADAPADVRVKSISRDRKQPRPHIRMGRIAVAVPASTQSRATLGTEAPS